MSLFVDLTNILTILSMIAALLHAYLTRFGYSWTQVYWACRNKSVNLNRDPNTGELSAHHKPMETTIDFYNFTHSERLQIIYPLAWCGWSFQIVSKIWFMYNLPSVSLSSKLWIIFSPNSPIGFFLLTTIWVYGSWWLSAQRGSHAGWWVWTFSFIWGPWIWSIYGEQWMCIILSSNAILSALGRGVHHINKIGIAIIVVSLELLSNQWTWMSIVIRIEYLILIFFGILAEEACIEFHSTKKDDPPYKPSSYAI